MLLVDDQLGSESALENLALRRTHLAVERDGSVLD